MKIPRHIERLLRKHKVRFWGRNYFVTPRLVSWIHGDGKKLIYFMPLNTRPDYYVLRIDSAMDLSSEEWYDLLETVYERIEDDFGMAHEEWESDNNGRTYRRHNYFPALDDECGSCWGELITASEL